MILREKHVVADEKPFGQKRTGISLSFFPAVAVADGKNPVSTLSIRSAEAKLHFRYRRQNRHA
ncbi:hypothetical protein HMPREF9012_1788 [Bacteroidetes bacterium oral taxon 272 str. F0290]|nr:hypothetical protein HMPREF9012_1788 [Bacteroidetes bacterium oral taxon 272 str. F0290]